MCSTKRIFSTVNGVITYSGGTHQTIANEYFTDAVDALAAQLRKDSGCLLNINQFSRHFVVLVFLKQNQPKFDSQNKARLVSDAVMPPLSIKELKDFLAGTPFLSAHTTSVTGKLAQDVNKEIKQMQKKKGLFGTLTKLVEAVGSGKGHYTLIVTEGDSAKALALNSLSNEQRKTFGVFPLRGKILNVRNNLKKLQSCKELQELFAAIGIEVGKKYVNVDELRYQRVLIMTDQDADGSHIKGLLINAFESLWPSLVRSKAGFLSVFSTPLIRVHLKSSKQYLSFYSKNEFNEWLQKQPPSVSYTAKYYKGLGTSTTSEGKEYFQDLEKNVMKVLVVDSDKQLLENIFLSQEVEWRKNWLTRAAPHSEELDLDRSQNIMTVSDFINKEMIHFALLGNLRALPHAIDGLKPSQRKILWACLKRNLKESIKVAQLSGYVSEVSSFHHGEASLQQTIIKMAQDFIGSNNINLLVPEGQFGSRQQSGSDHAASRYIFTKLSRFARLVFPAQDDELLNYVEEEGQQIEPLFYVPVVPLLLCNGSVGIGFGFANSTPMFHPLDVITAVRRLLNGEAAEHVCRDLVPWAVGFRGLIQRSESGTAFDAIGRYSVRRKDSHLIVRVEDIPWTMSIEDFRGHLAKLTNEEKVLKVADYSGANHVDVDVVISPSSNVQTGDDIENLLGLTTRIQCNSTVFSPDGIVHPLGDQVLPILKWHYELRLSLYRQRKELYVQNMREHLEQLRSTRTFTQKLRTGEIDFTKASDDDLHDLCRQWGLVRVSGSYDYLLKRPISFFTKTSVAKLEENIESVEVDIERLTKTSPEDLWVSDLDKLQREVESFEADTYKLLQEERRKIPHGETVPALQQPTEQRGGRRRRDGNSASGPGAQGREGGLGPVVFAPFRKPPAAANLAASVAAFVLARLLPRLLI
jgi:DNA topoisomerase-2